VASTSAPITSRAHGESLRTALSLRARSVHIIDAIMRQMLHLIEIPVHEGRIGMSRETASELG
jgi:hypothetical protein